MVCQGKKNKKIISLDFSNKIAIKKLPDDVRLMHGSFLPFNPTQSDLGESSSTAGA
jgi:hypothetical protein